MLGHDVAIMISGGIGITPYLSLLEEVSLMTRASVAPVNFATKKVILHWMCREAALIDYVSQEYFEPLMQSTISSRLHIDIIVHNTGDSRRKEHAIERASSPILPVYVDIHGVENGQAPSTGNET